MIARRMARGELGRHEVDLVCDTPAGRTAGLAERLVQPFGLRQLPHPVDLPKIAINLFWHAKYHKDPANRWLRDLVFDLHADGGGAGS